MVRKWGSGKAQTLTLNLISCNSVLYPVKPSIIYNSVFQRVFVLKIVHVILRFKNQYNQLFKKRVIVKYYNCTGSI